MLSLREMHVRRPKTFKAGVEFKMVRDLSLKMHSFRLCQCGWNGSKRLPEESVFQSRGDLLGAKVKNANFTSSAHRVPLGDWSACKEWFGAHTSCISSSSLLGGCSPLGQRNGLVLHSS